MRCAWEKSLKETKSSETHFFTSAPTTTPDHHRREENIHIQANKLGVIMNGRGKNGHSTGLQFAFILTPVSVAICLSRMLPTGQLIDSRGYITPTTF